MVASSNNTRRFVPISVNKANIFVLQLMYGLTFINILTANNILLWRLVLKMKKTQTNIFFIFLSVSDILVALTSIPVLSLALFNPLTPGCLIPCDVFIFFNYFPYAYSWLLTSAIALDRCLLITKKYKFERSRSKTRTFGIALILLVFEFVLSFAYTFIQAEAKILSQSLIEAICIFITISSYLYSWYYVRKSTNNEATNHGNVNNTSARLTRVIAYIFFCQVVLTFPQWMNLLTIATLAVKITVKILINRRATYRWMMILRFQSCYLNAFILLYNQYKEYKISRRRIGPSQFARNFRLKENASNTSTTTT